MRKQYLSAPLPFQGQKRMFAKEYINVLQQFPDGTTFVDLFGGSGLLSHIAKCQKPNSTVVLGETGAESNQAPCLSLVQFQIEGGELLLSAYQRSSDANLGLPADIYHLYLMTRQIDLPLKNITLNLGNVHLYENNIERTKLLLDGDESVKFELNV